MNAAIQRCSSNSSKGDPKQIPTTKMRISAFFVFTCGFFISSVFRSINATQAHYLKKSLHLSTSDLGLLTAVFFLFFGLFQLPLGVLLDRFGARLTQISLMIIAFFGTLLFASGSQPLTLTLARILIGISMSGGLMTAFIINAKYFPDKLPLMNSLTLGFGSLGVLITTKPCQIMMALYGWRVLNVILAGLILCVILWLFFFTPNDQPATASESIFDNIKQLKRLYTDSFFWHITPLVICLLGVSLTCQGLWAGIWLQQVNHFTIDKTANCLLISAIGFIIGMFLIGIVGNALKKRGISLLTTLRIISGISIATLLLIVLDFNISPFALWFVFFLSAQSAMLSYAIFSNYFPRQDIGRAMTGLNIFVFFMAFTMQYTFGKIAHFFNSPKPALGFLVMITFLSWLWLFDR